MALVHDHDPFPLLLYRFEGETTPEDAEQFEVVNTRALERARDEGVKVFLLCDALGTQKVGAAARQRFAENSKAQQAHFADQSGGTVVLLSNPIVRGAMTAIGWIAPEVVKDAKVAKDLDRGLEVLRALGKDAGQPIDEALISLMVAKHYPDAA